MVHYGRQRRAYVPAGISLEMISEQHFTETQRLTGEIAEISEELGTF